MSESPRIILQMPEKPDYSKMGLAGMVRISPEAELAVRRLSGETGLSLSKVATALLLQAAAICEVIPAKGGERQ